MRESKAAWQPLRRVLLLAKIHHLRIEQRSTPGVPDVNIHIPGIGDIWIELKAVTAPDAPDRAVEIGLEKEQFIWLRDARKAGRLVVLLARVGSVWYLWETAAGWELAKHSSPWRTLQSLARRFDGPGEVLGYLRSLATPRQT